jgi:hypothetical protein
MPKIGFSVKGKKQLRVVRTGTQGAGNIVAIILPVTRRRWRGLELDLENKTAQWNVFGSKTHAQRWIESIGQSREDKSI